MEASKSIENRVAQKYGLTDDPIMAVWILRDGRVVNGSHEGRQRDIDHRDISEFFKRSVFETRAGHGATSNVGSIYIDKFLRRGNIRWSGNELGFIAEIMGKPSKPAILAMARYMYQALDAGIPAAVTYHVHTGEIKLPDGRLRQKFESRQIGFLMWLDHLASYNEPLYAMIQNEHM